MGQDIHQSHFRKTDFHEFQKRLDEETRILADMVRDNDFEQGRKVAGYELETWLTCKKGYPSPSNESLLAKINNDEIVSELALYNIEVNGPPKDLSANSLSEMEQDIQQRWDLCMRKADELNLNMVSIGILPTLENKHLGLAAMSPAKRYRALNEQVLRLREGKPIQLDLKGKDHLKLEHQDVMLEAAATSFQIHLQMDLDKAAHYYNLSKIISAPMVAACANSPFLFGKELWEESRIPLFEQAVAVGGTDYCRRVTFGVRYLEGPVFDVFEANRQRYPVLLPLVMETEPEKLKHLSLHNGTIWRWTRPIIGFNEQGKATVRIEHRTVPAGPTLLDQTANMAFFLGLITEMAGQQDWIRRIPHKDSLDNFYTAAKKGIHADINWLDGKKVNLRSLCLHDLLPKAAKGLKSLNIDSAEAEFYLGILHNRLKSGQTGADWQKKWVAKHGKAWNELTMQYSENQQRNKAVHTWEV